MMLLPFKDIDYCKYGMKYRKRTRLWNNISNWQPKELCKKDCGNIEGNRHVATAQCQAVGKKRGETGHYLNSKNYM
jgi:hypothetical protein